MKTFAKLMTVGSVLALAACASGDNGGQKVHNYEAQAPYASERTVGSTNEVATERKAEKIYESRQMK